MIILKISPSEKCSKVANTYVVYTIIDSSLPINISQNSVVANKVCCLINEDVSKVCGINGSRLKILRIFYGEVEIQGAYKNKVLPFDNMVLPFDGTFG